MGGLQHGVGLPHAGGIAKKDFQSSPGGPSAFWMLRSSCSESGRLSSSFTELPPSCLQAALAARSHPASRDDFPPFSRGFSCSGGVGHWRDSQGMSSRSFDLAPLPRTGRRSLWQRNARRAPPRNSPLCRTPAKPLPAAPIPYAPLLSLAVPKSPPLVCFPFPSYDGEGDLNRGFLFLLPIIPPKRYG